MATDNQHIPSGYKPSPLGIIPEDWEVKRLGDCFTFKQGVQFSIQEQYTDYKTGLIRFIRIVDLTQGDEPPRYVKDPGVQHHITEQDLFMIRYGTPGIVGFGYIGVIANNLFRLIPKREINKYYFYQVFKMLEPELLNLSCSSSMAAINFSTLERVYLKYPVSLQEQTNVSFLLKTWDTAIEKQSELIERLTLRKRGLMQQLLTGKKRLKGFEGKWKEVRLGDVALVIGGGTPNTNIPDYWDGDIPWFTPSEIGENKYVNISKRTITEKGLNDSSAKILPKGTILFTSRATIGAKAILTTEATTNQGFQSLVVTNGNNNEFIYYYLDIIINEIKQKASGSTFPEVSAESIRKTAIKIPNVNEQNAIASVLVNADKEIEIQKQKLTAMQEQKKGLMQVLLTGRKRTKTTSL